MISMELYEHNYNLTILRISGSFFYELFNLMLGDAPQYFSAQLSIEWIGSHQRPD